MTRKKSRPQQNVSPKKTNEGCFYKMFWDSMEGTEGRPTDEMTSPGNVLPVNSPTVIVINDSDDENPLSIDDNSADPIVMSFPIKEEPELCGGDDNQSNQDTLDRLQCELSNEDGVVSSLQPTSDQQISSPLHEDSLTASQNVLAINSPVHNSDETPSLSENVLQLHSSECSNGQNDSITTKPSESAMNTDESSNLPDESVSLEVLTSQENGVSNGMVADERQVCGSVTPQHHQIEQSIEIDNSMTLNSDNNTVNETCSDLPDQMNVDVHSEPNSDPPLTLSESTGQALNLLKSLLLVPDDDCNLVSKGNSDDCNSVSNGNSDDVNVVDICNINRVPSEDPLQVDKEMCKTPSESNVNVPLPSIVPSCGDSNVSPPDDDVSPPKAMTEVLPEGNLLSQPSPTLIKEVSPPHPCPDDPFPILPSVNIDVNESKIGGFPMSKHFILKRLKVEHNRVFDTLELLKSELFSLYNDPHVKIAFDDKMDESMEVIAEPTEEENNVEDDFPNLNTGSCCVFVERVPSTIVRKGSIATTGKRFQSWKSRIIKQRNEEKFKHLKVWRRGRTLLWRECELAGMDRETYDDQVAYIKKHIVNETSSSESESSDDDDDEQNAASEDQVGSGNSTDASSSDESDASEACTNSGKLSSSPDTSPSKLQKKCQAVNRSIPAKSTTKSRECSSASEQSEFSSLEKGDSSCRDEYVVERNTVNDHELNSEGKKTSALKITIRKTSVSKSEDEKEKTVDSEVENNFTVPNKPSVRKVKRTFVTKRTYRKAEDTTRNTTSNAGSPQKSSPPDSRKRKLMFVEDDDTESLLGRRAHEVENDNLLEKWLIPFEAPTLFRSPRVASKLAQLKNKETFRTNVRQQTKVQKPAPINKDIKDIVDNLCVKTVEAMLIPDIMKETPSRDSQRKELKKNEASTPVVPNKPQKSADILPSQIETPSRIDEELIKSQGDDDFSDQSSIVPNEEPSSAMEESSEAEELPHKGTAENRTNNIDQSPKVTRVRKRRYGRRSIKSKAKSNVPTTVPSKMEEDVDLMKDIQLPKVVVSPLNFQMAFSTQVPVVSEGPGQSPHESEDDSMLNKNSAITSKNSEKSNESCKEGDKNQMIGENLKDGRESMPEEIVQPVAHTHSVVESKDGEDVILPRVTRSKHAVITVDPSIIDNYGARKKKKSDVAIEGTAVPAKPSVTDEQKITPKSATRSRKSKGKMMNEQPEDNLKDTTTPPLSKGTVDSNMSNTQVDEVSEGPGEVVSEPEGPMRRPSDYISKSDDSLIDSELESIEAGKVEALKQSHVIPDSPMSPTPETVDPEPISVRITRSKKRMIHEGPRYITVKPTKSIEEEQVMDVELENHQISNEHNTNTLADNGSSLDILPQPDIVEHGIQGTLESNGAEGCSQIPSEIPQSVTAQENIVLDNTPIVATDVVEEMPNRDSNLLDNQALEVPVQEEIPESIVKDTFELQELSAKSLEITSKTTEENSEMSGYLGEDVISNESDTPQLSSAVFDVQPDNSLITKEVTPHAEPIIAQIDMPFINFPNIDIFDKTSKKNDFNDSDLCGNLIVDFSDDEIQTSDIENQINHILGYHFEDEVIPEIARRALFVNDSQPIDGQNEVISGFEKELEEPQNDDVSSVANEKSTPELEITASEQTNLTVNEKESLEKKEDPVPVVSEPKGVAVSKDIPPAKRSDSIDEKTGLPNVLIQKLRDPRIRSKLLSRLEDEVSDKKSSPQIQTQTPINEITGPTHVPVSEAQSVSRDPRALRIINDPRNKVETPATSPLTPVTRSILKNPLDQTTANLATPVGPNMMNILSTTVVPPMMNDNLPKPVQDLEPSAPVCTNIEASDDEEEESIKRRSKKPKKEIDTELMYKSPLEDLQVEARPTYGRQQKPPRRFSNKARRQWDTAHLRSSRWDVQYNSQMPHENRQHPEVQRPYNQDRWSAQNNENINRIQSSNSAWNQNWFQPPKPQQEPVFHEPRISYIETQFVNLALRPKTTNLSVPPKKKIYKYFNNDNPQMLHVPPPTYDPKEELRNLTTPDAQETVDIFQIPRPTSGLREDYFASLPCECSLEDLVRNSKLDLSNFAVYEKGIDLLFEDSDEESKPVSKTVKKPVVLAPKPAPVSSINPLNSAITEDDPLRNILNCLPQLKEQYSFKPNPQVMIAENEASMPTDKDGSIVTPPPPPIWSKDVDLRPQLKPMEKVPTTGKEDKLPIKNWRNPSPPKTSQKKHARRPRSRSKSPSKKRKSRSKSPTWRRRSTSRSASPKPPGRRSRSRSSSVRRRSWSRERSKSRSPQRSRRYRRGSPRSPDSYKGSTSLSPSRKRGSRR